MTNNILVITDDKGRVELGIAEEDANVVIVSSFDEVDEFNFDLVIFDFYGFNIAKTDDRIINIPVIFADELDSIDLKVRLCNFFETENLKQTLNDLNAEFEKKLLEHIKLIDAMQMETIFSLAKLAQSRDDDTGKHLDRVKEFCYALAIELSKKTKFQEVITEEFIENIRNASPLHDIGKVAITDLILLKQGKLTQEEFETMKTHTVLGYDTLNEVDSKFGDNTFIQMGKVIARSHHERWDGTGYPDKLKGEEIPLAARIMSIADVYDALRARRAYKEPFSHEKSCAIIMEGKGNQFDPDIIDAFSNVQEDFDRIYKRLND
ncbi:MAG: HD domain-containing protein [Candidatus Gastranaerophilales bacterium]|nr:HD domain-containing protein [Candidatus Gastranaerophilales bacterium]